MARMETPKNFDTKQIVVEVELQSGMLPNFMTTLRLAMTGSGCVMIGPSAFRALDPTESTCVRVSVKSHTALNVPALPAGGGYDLGDGDFVI